MLVDGGHRKGRQHPLVELTSKNLDFITSVVVAQVADGVVRPRARCGKSIEQMSSSSGSDASEEGKMDEGSDVEEASEEKKMDEQCDAEES